MESLILYCEDSMDGIFTAIYDGFLYKKKASGTYQDEIHIQIGDDGQNILFARTASVVTDSGKAQKTADTIRKQLGFSIYEKIVYALCHYDEARADAVFGYLVRAFRMGPRIEEMLSDPYVMRVMELSRKTANECQKLYGFLRFRQLEQFLYASFEPKCDAIPVILSHFEDRYPNENFVIYDRRRNYALVHPVFGKSFYVRGSEFPKLDFDSLDAYEDLWKIYFRHMEIKERHNEQCQTNLLPKWYRADMIEFE